MFRKCSRKDFVIGCLENMGFGVNCDAINRNAVAEMMYDDFCRFVEIEPVESVSNQNAKLLVHVDECGNIFVESDYVSGDNDNFVEDYLDMFDERANAIIEEMIDDTVELDRRGFVEYY